MRRLALGLAALLVLAGHLYFWYGPREHPAAPAAGDLPARLLAATDFEVALWVAYPHQNLGALAGQVGDPAAYLAAAARAAGLPPPALPRFGPFAVPPARELTLASDLSGRRFVVAARIYPLVAVVARLAGRLAGNPWLAGGRVDGDRGEVEVRWQGTLWTVSSPPGALPAASAPGAAPPSALPASLACLRTRQRFAPFPAGLYRLARDERGLALATWSGGGSSAGSVDGSGGSGALAAVDSGALAALDWRALAALDWRALAALAGDAELVVASGGGEGEGPGALALFAGGGRGLAELPPAAALSRPGERRWSLPGEELAGLLGRRPKTGMVDGWEVVALSADGYAGGAALAPRLSALLGGEGGEGAARLALGLRLQPRAALDLLDRVVRVLEAVPLIERRQVQRWRDWRTLLAPFAGFDSISLAVTRSPDAAELVLADRRR